MSKFKVGDKVSVKQGVDTFPCEFGVISEIRNDGINDGVIVVIHGVELWYAETELLDHQRTLLGLENEYNHTYNEILRLYEHMMSLEEQIEKLQEREE